MRSLFITIVLLAALSAPAGAGETAELGGVSDLPRNARLALFGAQEDLDRGDLQGAADELEKYFAKNQGKEDNYVMRFHYGNILARQGRLDEAAVQYEKSVALEPRYADAWLGLGETSHATGNYARAGEAINEAYQRSSEKRPELLYFSGASYIMAGDAATAIPLLETLLDQTDDAAEFPWHRALISAYVETGDTARGQAAVERMLAGFREDPAAWHLAFQFAAGTGDYRMAAVALTVTGYLRPLERRELLQLGDLYAAIDVPFVAGEYYAEAVADSASPREYERLASAYLAAYDSEEALTTLERAIAAEPTYRLLSLLGDLHYMEKRYNQSLEAYAQAAQLNPEDGRPLLMMGYCAYELGDMSLAIENLRLAAAFEDYAPRAQTLIRHARRAGSVPGAEVGTAAGAGSG